jgi:hypothetical protein
VFLRCCPPPSIKIKQIAHQAPALFPLAASCCFLQGISARLGTVSGPVHRASVYQWWWWKALPRSKGGASEGHSKKKKKKTATKKAILAKSDRPTFPSPFFFFFFKQAVRCARRLRIYHRTWEPAASSWLWAGLAQMRSPQSSIYIADMHARLGMHLNRLSSWCYLSIQALLAARPTSCLL